jgi:hypothetical protein
MNKQQLAGVLADVIEEGMKRKMARQVGCDEDSDQRTIALGALRMLHDVLAIAAICFSNRKATKSRDSLSPSKNPLCPT